MNLHDAQAQFITRRHFLRRCQVGLGSLALGSLMGLVHAGELDLPTLAHRMAAGPASVLGERFAELLRRDDVLVVLAEDERVLRSEITVRPQDGRHQLQALP